MVPTQTSRTSGPKLALQQPPQAPPPPKHQNRRETTSSYVIIWSQNNRRNRNLTKTNRKKNKEEKHQKWRGKERTTVRKRPNKNQYKKKLKKETPSMKRQKFKYWEQKSQTAKSEIKLDSRRGCQETSFKERRTVRRKERGKKDRANNENENVISEPNQRKVTSWTFCRGIPEQKFEMWIVLVFQRKTPEFTQKWAKFIWTFRFGPFFGLVCRGDSWSFRSFLLRTNCSTPREFLCLDLCWVNCEMFHSTTVNFAGTLLPMLLRPLPNSLWKFAAAQRTVHRGYLNTVLLLTWLKDQQGHHKPKSTLAPPYLRSPVTSNNWVQQGGHDGEVPRVHSMQQISVIVAKMAVKLAV